MIEPAVWVPNPSGIMRSATPAAEPLEEPPGVWTGLWGLRVGRAGGELGGDCLAEDETARRARERHAGSVGLGPKSLVGLRAVGGRHVPGIHDVFDADGDAVQRAAPRAAVERLSRGDRLLLIEVLPGSDGRLALGDAVEIGAHQRFGGESAALDPRGGVDCGEAGQV
jgi:hypothetical protein